MAICYTRLLLTIIEQFSILYSCSFPFSSCILILPLWSVKNVETMVIEIIFSILHGVSYFQNRELYLTEPYRHTIFCSRAKVNEIEQIEINRTGIVRDYTEKKSKKFNQNIQHKQKDVSELKWNRFTKESSVSQPHSTVNLFFFINNE